MRIAAIFGIAAAMLLFANDNGRADTCYETAQVNIDCSPKGAASGSGSTASQSSQSQNLRDTLRRALQSTKNAPPQSPAIDDAEQRWGDARASAQDATYRAQQTDDPDLKAQLQQQYDTAVSDLHQAGADLIAADPQQKAKIQALLKTYDTQGAKAAAAAGFEPPAKAAAAAPQPPALPDNVTQIGANTYVCDGPVAGTNNVSCRQISADGKQCTSAMLADGDVSWQDSIDTPCNAGDLAQRKAFLLANPDAAGAVIGGPTGAFNMDKQAQDKGTAAALSERLGLALDTLPPECRADFEKFLASGNAKTAANAGQAASSYAKLDNRPQCRDGMKRIAEALRVGLPRRKVAAGDRNDWNTALAGPQRAGIADIPDIDVSNIPDTGFDPGDSLDSAIDMLNALSGGLGALQGSMRSMPSYRPAPAYRAPAPRPTQTYTYTPRRNSGNNSDITGTH
jgi:hypothetical protein